MPRIQFLPLAHPNNGQVANYVKPLRRENRGSENAMKSFMVLLLIILILSVVKQDNSFASIAAGKNSAMMDYLYQHKIAGLEYKITARKLAKGARYQTDMFEIRYELTNTGNSDYVLFNRGHSGYDQGRAVYIEPQGVNGAEISQKAFAEPKGKNCPLRYEPIIARASWLKAGQTVKERLLIPLPLKLHTPFDDCSPQAKMPQKIAGIKFCLGLAKADRKKLKIGKDSLPNDFTIFGQQEYLCSDPWELN